MNRQCRLIPIDCKNTPRILARTLLRDGKIETMMLIDSSKEAIIVSVAYCETANTVFVDGILAILDRENADIDDIKKLEQFACEIHTSDKTSFLSAICSEMASKQLFGNKTKDGLMIYQLTFC